MGRFTNERSPWYESPEDIEAGLERAKERAKLLRWVRIQMSRRLTKRERRCIELYFFKGMTFREAAEATQTTPSSIHRAVRRSLLKLRHAAAVEEGSEPDQE